MKNKSNTINNETCCVYCEECGQKMVNVNEGREALHWGQAWYECTNIDCPLCPEHIFGHEHISSIVNVRLKVKKGKLPKVAGITTSSRKEQDNG